MSLTSRDIGALFAHARRADDTARDCMRAARDEVKRARMFFQEAREIELMSESHPHIPTIAQLHRWNLSYSTLMMWVCEHLLVADMLRRGARRARAARAIARVV